MSQSNLAGAAGRASLAAGPLFLLLLALAGYVQSAPAAYPVSQGDLSAIIYIPFLLLAATVVGILLAFPICLLAGGVLWFVADIAPLMRSAVIWIAAGGGLALAILRLLDSMYTPVTYAFAGTAMVCAAVVRFSLDWE